ncbi:hypothetical protein Tco_0165262, partial [Tanacetum coccineum]
EMDVSQNRQPYNNGHVPDSANHYNNGPDVTHNKLVQE